MANISNLLLLVFILLSPTILRKTHGDVPGQGKQEKQSSAGTVQDAISLLRSHFHSWDKVKSAIHQMQLRIFPPNLDFRSADNSQATGSGGGGNGDDGAGGKMKEAAEKSFGTSKVAIEETAKSAAKVVGEVMHKTTGKVKENVYVENESSKSEL